MNENNKAVNPQKLADEIMDRALASNSGSAVDDMTVVCAKIIEM